MPAHERRKAPPIHRIMPVPLPEVRQMTLRNGIEVYAVPHPSQQALKVDWIFRAGRPHEEKRLASRASARLLREGTLQHRGAELADLFDFYGSSVQTPASLDNASIVLYGLGKYAHDILPLFAELIRHPVFPEEELAIFQENNIQELLVDLEKVEIVAYRELTEALFGAGHPYGYNSTPEMYRALKRDDLVQHHARWHTPSRSAVILSGGVSDQVLQLMESLFGDAPEKASDTPDAALPPPPLQPVHRSLRHPGSLQTAIKIGRRLFSRHHPDYNAMMILNTVLGGYFGSRLSMNVREKLGYTYNIYSSIDAMVYDGFLYIDTEVDHKNAAAAQREIFGEMRRLQDELISEAELDMVRNYLLGMLLNGLDGPLNASILLRSYVVDQLPLEAYEELTDTVRHVTPATLRDMAQRYLNAEAFSVVTVGP